MMSMVSDDNMTLHEDEEDDIYEDEHDHDHDHDQDHPHRNLSRLSICTTNSSKHSIYDHEDDDMMMFMSALSIEDCDADDEELSDKASVVSSDSDKTISCMSLPGTPAGRVQAHGGVLEKEIRGCSKEYSSENEALNGGEKKSKRNSRRRVVREKWLEQAWEEKRCKAKAIMDHEEDMMVMEDHDGRRRHSLCMDLEEIKACRDLGFEMEMPSRTSRISVSCSTLDTTSSGGNSPIANWRISSPGDDPKDVKARLKVWAQAVAMASASRFLGDG